MPHGKSRKLYEGNENYFDLEATNKSSVKLLKVGFNIHIFDLDGEEEFIGSACSDCR